MKKNKLLLLSALSLAGTSLAADVSFSGSLEADYGTYFDKNFVVDNRANQDLLLMIGAARLIRCSAPAV